MRWESGTPAVEPAGAAAAHPPTPATAPAGSTAARASAARVAPEKAKEEIVMRSGAIIGLGLGLVLGGCVERHDGPAPLRAAESELERAYVRCVSVDPFFKTQSCREVRARLLDDPSPGLLGR